MPSPERIQTINPAVHLGLVIFCCKDHHVPKLFDQTPKGCSHWLARCDLHAHVECHHAFARITSSSKDNRHPHGECSFNQELLFWCVALEPSDRERIIQQVDVCLRDFCLGVKEGFNVKTFADCIRCVPPLGLAHGRCQHRYRLRASSQSQVLNQISQLLASRIVVGPQDYFLALQWREVELRRCLLGQRTSPTNRTCRRVTSFVQRVSALLALNPNHPFRCQNVRDVVHRTDVRELGIPDALDKRPELFLGLTIAVQHGLPSDVLHIVPTHCNQHFAICIGVDVLRVIRCVSVILCLDRMFDRAVIPNNLRLRVVQIVREHLFDLAQLHVSAVHQNLYDPAYPDAAIEVLPTHKVR